MKRPLTSRTQPNRNTMKTRAASILILLLFVIFVSHGQIIVQTGPEITPLDMVEMLVDEGVQFKNVTFQGADVARGVFTNGDFTNLGIASGIFFTTGDGNDIPGPNTSASISTNNGMSGHAALEAITTSTTYDAAVLEFDVQVESDSLQIRWIFASEDYSENVGWVNFVDVCGIFITGPKPEGGFYADHNIAVVPGTDSIVTVNSINSTSNSQYFIDNTGGLTIEFDGFTTVLTAKLAVVPCEDYHLKIGVADAGDPIYDSGIFLEINTFKRPLITYDVVLEPPGLETNMYESVIGAHFCFYLPDPDFSPLTIQFDVGGTTDPTAFGGGWGGDFLEDIPTSVSFGPGEDSASFFVMPVSDGIIEGDENLVFMFADPLGCAPRYDTIETFVESYFDPFVWTFPNTFICEGMTIDLIAYYFNGYPPLNILWEPGGYSTDTISVTPDTTTTYYVKVWDVVDTAMDSVKVTVLPVNYEITAFSFEKENNPELPWDVIGEIFEDSISLDVPSGTNLTNLVASYFASDSSWMMVNGVPQESGQTPNDFTNPLLYEVFGLPGGCSKEWIVCVNVVTGTEGLRTEELISIHPNPANKMISIRNAEGFDLFVLNELGEVLIQEDELSDNQVVQIQNFSPGVYFLQFRKDSELVVRKLIVQ